MHAARAPARARTRADLPGPEITLEFGDEEVPTAALPKPALSLLLREMLNSAEETAIEAEAAPAVAEPAATAAPLSARPKPGPPATVIVAGADAVMLASAEETERIQRRRVVGEGVAVAQRRPRSRWRGSAGWVIAAGLFVATAAGALIWRFDLVDAGLGERAKQQLLRAW